MVIFPFLEMLENEEDKSRFKQLYDEYRDMVMFIGLKYLKNNFALAEDACHDVFTYLAAHFEKIDDEIQASRTKNFVATLARGTAINLFHKEFNPKHEYLEELENFDISDDNALNRFDKVEMKMAMEKLPEEDQTYIILSGVFGYTSAEIGEAFDLKPATVRKHLQLSKAKMRKDLEVKL